MVRVFLAACPEGDVSEGLRVVWKTEVSGQDSHNDTNKIDLRTTKVNCRSTLVMIRTWRHQGEETSIDTDYAAHDSVSCRTM
jgi:hypothetical protein